MGDISPVLASYLGGFQSGSDNIAKAHEYGLKKQQLDQTIKQFQAEMIHQSKQLDLQQQIHNLTKQHDEAEYMKALPEMLAKHPEIAGLTPNATPGVQSTPGTSPDGLPMNVPGMTMQNLPPAPGSPVTMNSPYGDMHLNMPKSEGQSAIEDALAQQKALMPGQEALYAKTIGDTKTKGLENQLALTNIKGDFANQVAAIRSEAAKYGADQRATTAAMNERLKLQSELFSMGLTMPGVTPSDIIKEHGNRLAQGYEDLNEVPPHLKGMVQSYLQQNSLTAPSGGKKFRHDLETSTQNANRLYSDFNDINQKFPATSTVGGKVVNSVQGMNPWSDINQAFSEYGKNIAGYANLEGETPGMMRSPTMALRAEKIKPNPTDNPLIRSNKQLDIADFALSKIAGGINSLQSPEQRKEYWKDAIDSMGAMKQDYRLAPVLTRILKEGKYDSSWLSDLRKN